jgi:DNA-binding NtrC family response regulator
MARILVCDDDDAFSGVVAAFLEKSGHAVSRCVDVMQLATVLGHEHADLLIVDMQMPGGGGPAAGRLLAAGHTSLPVIVCSGMPPEAQKGWFPTMLRVRFLQKPVPLDVLRKNVEELLASPAA